MSGCPYRYLFGKPGEGAHASRFLGLSIVDTVLTFLGALLITYMTGYPILWTFIGFFVLAILAGTYLPFLQNFNSIISEISRDTLKVALFLIGAGLSLQSLKNIGIKPLLLGIILWIFISSISLYAVLEFLK
jgi:hypothetical protein